MPFVSEAQRRFMWVHHPEIARRWAHEKEQKNLPMHARRKVTEALMKRRAR